MRPDKALASRLAGWPEPVYVVIDGARFDDVEAVCARADLSARSLFLEHRDPAIVAAGPFLAKLGKSKLDRLLAIAEIETACAFWHGDVSEPALFRHLRSLNLAEIPLHRGPEDAPGSPATETVLFRHWDPAVLAMVLPVLEPAQRARLFGPMKRLCIYDKVGGAALQGTPRADWPPPVRGFLRLSSAQIARIGEAMAARSRFTIASFLRNTAPAHTAGLNDESLLTEIARSEAYGRRLGLRTERGFGRWAYLMLVSKGAIAESNPASNFITSGPESPDVRVGILLLAMADAMTMHTKSR